MQFAYRLRVVVISTATFLAGAFAISLVAIADAPTGTVEGDVSIAIPSAVLITWFVIKVWCWIRGPETRATAFG